MKNLLLLSTIIFAMLLNACDVDSIDASDVRLPSNTPIVANAATGYSYTLSLSEDFSNSRTDQISFASNTVDYSLVVSNFTEGSASIIFLNSDGNTIREDLIMSDLVVAQNDLLLEDLDRITLTFEGFSGTVVLAIAP